MLTKYDRIELIEGEMIDTPPIGKMHSVISSHLNELFVSKAVGAVLVVAAGPANLGDFSTFDVHPIGELLQTELR